MRTRIGILGRTLRQYREVAAVIKLGLSDRKIMFVFVAAAAVLSSCIPSSWASPSGGEDLSGRLKAKRSVTVTDMIGMTLPGESMYTDGIPDPHRIAIVSPDRKQFIVLLQRGEMATNGVKYSLLLFDADNILRHHEGKVLFSMTSSSNRPAISHVKWRDDSNVMFLGAPGEAVAEVYGLNVKTRGVTRLTRHPTNIFEYDFNPRRGDVVFAAELGPDVLAREAAKRRGILVETQSPAELLTGEDVNVSMGFPAELYIVDSDRDHERKLKTLGAGAGWLPLHLSPNGRYLIAETIVNRKPPDIWNTYDNRRLQAAIEAVHSEGQLAWIRQLELIDLESGESRFLLNAPIPPGDYPDVVWASDSRHAAVAMMYLPLEKGVDTIGLEKRRSSRFALDIDIESGAISPITEDSIHLQQWDAYTGELHGHLGRYETGALKQGDPVAYKRTGGRWGRVPAKAYAGFDHGRSDVSLEQGMNSAPRIVARDPATGQSAEIYDLNPQFSGLSFGEVKEISISRASGQSFRLGLYLPVGYRPDHRYPLIIQTHGWDPNMFWIDGPFTTAFAAQALAGAGFVVAQLDDLRTSMSSMTDIEMAAHDYDAVIQHLVADGTVDPDRIGITGFSITGLSVDYALTHSRYRFAAATLADCSDLGYFLYVSLANYNPNYAQLMERVHGGPPVGNTLHLWLDSGLDFGLEKTSTPLRLEVNRAATLLWAWEPFALFRSLKKAVELIYIPDGDHVLVKPWNRYTSQEGNVDWFRFWLQNYKDPDPLKRDQYARWERLREQHGTPRSKGAVADD